MIFFKKTKPELVSLIPQGFIDIHSHILPKVDDGPKNIGETKQLITGMRQLGFNKCIATPHTLMGIWDNTPQTIHNSWNSCKTQLNGEMSFIQNYASEYMLDYNLISLIEQDLILPLFDNFILVEMSYKQKPQRLSEILFELTKKGFRPILSHPERYSFLHDDFKQYEKLKNNGVYFQLNLLSAVGYYGKNMTRIAEKLVENDMIDFVGSDIHHQRHIDNFHQKVVFSKVDLLENAIAKNNEINADTYLVAN